jgi:hypothetical protein
LFAIGQFAPARLKKKGNANIIYRATLIGGHIIQELLTGIDIQAAGFGIHKQQVIGVATFTGLTLYAAHKTEAYCLAIGQLCRIMYRPYITQLHMNISKDCHIMSLRTQLYQIS